MPILIPMSMIQAAGQSLAGGLAAAPAPDVRVRITGGRMSITEAGREVFSMRQVTSAPPNLIVDYPNNAPGQDGRGWGRLGLFAALRYGTATGCTQIQLGSNITGGWSLWAMFGIAGTAGTTVRRALDLGINWVVQHCPQPSPANIVLVIRDAQVGVGGVAVIPPRARSNSFTGSRSKHF